MSPLIAAFDEKGGTIGRAAINDFVLVDEEKVVSNNHASIEFENGSFYYTDSSLNGTHILNRDQLLHHEKALLHDQDQLRIGDYDLTITISQESPEIQPQGQPPSFLSVFGKDSFENGRQISTDFFAKDDLPNSLENELSGAPPEVQKHTDRDFGPVIDESCSPPNILEPLPNSSALPHDLSLKDFFQEESQGAQSEPDDTDDRDVPFPDAMFQNDGSFDSPEQNGHARHTAETVVSDQFAVDPPDAQIPLEQRDSVKRNDERITPQDTNHLVDLFFKGLGIEDAGTLLNEQPAYTMSTAAAVFRELISGLMTILRGRTELKSQLRVAMTIIKQVENNPLKFSMTLEDAIKVMLSEKQRGFMTPVEAVHEGFEDIKNHQLAITAGVQASLGNILKRFAPDQFEQKFKEGLVIQKKTKCWNEFCKSYPQIVESAIEDFFGDAFVDAYEAQMDKLRNDRKKHSH